MKRLGMVIAGVVVALMGGWMLAGYLPTRNIETPKYEVISAKNGYEIRQYQSQIVAEAKVSGTYKESVNQGFRKIAGFIFGNNTASGSIAMTAPVLHEKQPLSEKISMTAPVLHGGAAETGNYTVAFVMPSSYTLDTLPKPNNPEVTVHAVPSKKYAALRFRGYAPESKVDQKTKRLLDLLNQDNLNTVGVLSVAEYIRPWTPPFMRRNEILVEVQ
jgi:effector-binding domain-containing protein